MFNWIGNYFARRIESPQTSDLSYSLPARSPLIKEGIFVVDASRPATFAECPRCGSVVSIGDASCKGCRAPIPPTASPIENTLFSPPGLELFIGRFFGCGTNIVHSGNVCCYGTVRRRRFYYCDNPRPNFYPLHDSDTSIILGSNEASPPPDWPGRAVLLSELFSLDESGRKIVAHRAPIRYLFPDNYSRPRFGRNRTNKRRNDWLQFFLDYIATIRTTDKGKRKSKYKRPGFKKIRDWFVANIAGASKCPRTYRRDIEEMTAPSPDKSNGTYDKRDHLVKFIWDHIEDPNFLFAPKAPEVILRELAKIKAEGTVDSASFLSDRTAAWENGSRTVSVNPDLDIDHDLR